jgi:glycosyltransferase involved in cell wall biosynthesis
MQIGKNHSAKLDIVHMKLNVLILAYGCGPKRGSDSGVGWEWADRLSNYYNVTVITIPLYKKLIEKYAVNKNIDVIYFNIPNIMEKIVRSGTSLHYVIWNVVNIIKCRKVCADKNIDLVHHVTLTQYLFPSMGLFLKKPFVYGPVGGGEIIPVQFFRYLNIIGVLKELFRRFLIYTKVASGLLFSPCTNIYFFYANAATKSAIEKWTYKNIPGEILPSIYADIQEVSTIHVGSKAKYNSGDGLHLILPGRLLDWKGHILALDVMREMIEKEYNVHLAIVGSGPLEKKISTFMQMHRLENNVTLRPNMPRQELFMEMSKSDLLLYPAFRDSGAMVIVEGYLLGIPSLVFNISSQWYLNDEIALIAHIEKTYTQTYLNFVNKLIWAYNNKNALSEMGSNGGLYLQEKLSWNRKISAVHNVYRKMLG